MRRTWLIDAHNLMHKLPHAERAYGRNRLEGITIVLQCVDQLCHKYRRKARLVFDGHKLHLPDRPETCRIDFSGNKPADLVIRNILRKKSSHNRYTVVSDDHEVQRFAAQAGCDFHRVSELSEEFSSGPITGSGDQSGKPSPGEDPGVELNDEEVKEWKNIFGID